MLARLCTRDGGFVRNVDTGMPFIVYPEAMIWGSRIFMRNVFLDIIDDGSLRAGYAEVCPWSVDATDMSWAEEKEP
jgi:hypothetical protein